MNTDRKVVINMKMRTSTKIIIAAFMIFAASLTFYNMALKAEYLTGKYKDQFRNFTSYNIKDFDEVQINASGIMHVSIKQGDFSVRKFNRSIDSVKIEKQGNRLVINLDCKTDPIDQSTGKIIRYSYNEVIITCPNLKLVKTDGFYTVNGRIPAKLQYNTKYSNDDENSVIVRSFKIDSLQIQQVEGVVKLEVDDIGSLNAALLGFSKLKINKGNKIAKAKIQLNNVTELEMPGVNIPLLSFKVADSAKVSLNGASIKTVLAKSNH